MFFSTDEFSVVFMSRVLPRTKNYGLWYKGFGVLRVQQNA